MAEQANKPTVLAPAQPDPLAAVAAKISADWAKLEQMEKATEEARKAFGKLLLDAKAKVGHGNFGNWIKEHCPSLHWRTANRYMELAKQPVKLDSVSNSTTATTASTSNAAPSATATIIDLLDSRMDRVIKALDKLKEKEGVEAAIDEIEKLKEALDAKEAELTKEKIKSDRKSKGRTAEQHVAA